MEQVIRMSTSITLAMLSGFVIKEYWLDSSTTSPFLLVIGIGGLILALVNGLLALVHPAARK